MREGAGSSPCEPNAEIEAAWDSEIKRRLDEIDSGAVKVAKRHPNYWTNRL